jgi:hypothetical protein
MKLQLIIPALLLAASGNLPAADSQQEAALAIVQALEEQTPFGPYFIELDDLIYVMFLAQTGETFDPIDVNAIDIEFHNDNNPEAYRRALNLP